MRRLLGFLIPFTICSFDKDNVSSVKKLDANNYHAAVKEHKHLLVEFFAPWCNHCKQFNPEYEKAAQLLTQEQPVMTLAQVDCTETHNVELCKSIPVKGYPTLMCYKDGKVLEKNPALRNHDQVVKFMRAKFSVPSFHIRTREHYNQQVNHPQGSFIGFFPSLQGTDQCGDPDAQAEAEKDPMYDYKRAYFKIVQGMIKDYRFAHVTDPALAAELFGTDPGFWNTLIYHRETYPIDRPIYLESKFEPLYHQYTSTKQTTGLVKKWVESLKGGLVPHVTQEDFHLLKRPIIMAYHNLDFKRDPKGARYWRNRLLKVASEMKDSPYQFAIGARKDFEKEIFEELGGNDSWGEKAPKIVIWDEAWNTYRMEIGQNCEPACDLAPDAGNLRAFLEKYERHEIERYIKSEKAPENNDGGVKIITGHTFEELVMDETKDVLIEFYAPWCGHCKSLEPIWEELGEMLNDDPNVVIAKMDATANHPPRHFVYEGFPTIFFAGMSNKYNPEKFKQSRTVESFLAYLRQKVRIKPMILNGAPDDIVYDDYDDSVVAASEAEIDEKYPEMRNPPEVDEVIDDSRDSHDEL